MFLLLNSTVILRVAGRWVEFPAVAPVPSCQYASHTLGCVHVYVIRYMYEYVCIHVCVRIFFIVYM